MNAATSSLSLRMPNRKPNPAGPADPDMTPLLEAARLGDPAALGQLYDLYSAPIYRFLARRTRDPMLAEDLTSVVFVRMLEAVRSGAVWRESFKSWLYRIAQNVLIDQYRSEMRRPQSELTEEMPCPETSTLEDGADRALRAQEVHSALAEIRPMYADVLRLRFADELSHAEAGALLDRNEDIVKVTQFRALKSLRKHLDERRIGEAA